MVDFESKGFELSLKRWAAGQEKALLQVLFLGAEDIRRIALQGIKKGRPASEARLVKKSASVTHYKSLPGEYPAADTGELTRNITTKKEANGDITVGSREQAPHGKYLEFGTIHIAPRPWLKPSIDAAKAKIKERLAKVFKNG